MLASKHIFMIHESSRCITSGYETRIFRMYHIRLRYTHLHDASLHRYTYFHGASHQVTIQAASRWITSGHDARIFTMHNIMLRYTYLHAASHQEIHASSRCITSGNDTGNFTMYHITDTRIFTMHHITVNASSRCITSARQFSLRLGRIKYWIIKRVSYWTTFVQARRPSPSDPQSPTLV